MTDTELMCGDCHGLGQIRREGQWAICGGCNGTGRPKETA